MVRDYPDTFPGAARLALHAERDYLVVRIRGQRWGQMSELTGKVLMEEKDFHGQREEARDEPEGKRVQRYVTSDLR
jgi:hypothetical protein